MRSFIFIHCLLLIVFALVFCEEIIININGQFTESEIVINLIESQRNYNNMPSPPNENAYEVHTEENFIETEIETSKSSL